MGGEFFNWKKNHTETFNILKVDGGEGYTRREILVSCKGVTFLLSTECVNSMKYLHVPCTYIFSVFFKVYIKDAYICYE